MIETRGRDGAASHRRAVTIRDVAQRAGVSKSTVSKLLTGTPYVSAPARSAIESAIEELGYEPNSAARSLTTGRTGFVGVVVASVLNPFYTQLVHAIDEEAARLGYAIMLASADRDPDREQRIVQGLAQRGVDGLLFASTYAADREVIALQGGGTPFVLASRHLTDVDVDYVIVDSFRGARMAVDHLLELGHRRIGHIGGPGRVLQMRERRAGHVAALADAGIAADDDLLVQSTQTSMEAGRAGLARLLDLPARRRPTAVFTATDFLAMGVLLEARARGVGVPGDLSLVGFDNVYVGELADPPLTTIDSRITELGRRATRLLVDRITRTGDPAPRHDVLQPDLVVRASTAPPRRS